MKVGPTRKVRLASPCYARWSENAVATRSENSVTARDPHSDARASHMRPLIWTCIVLYTLAMAAVSFAAHWIVGNYGGVGALLTIAAMYAAAVYWEWRLRTH